MRPNMTNIDMKPDWQTFYDPRQVGEYINTLELSYGEPGQVIKLEPGMYFPPSPKPNLNDFLSWVANQENK